MSKDLPAPSRRLSNSCPQEISVTCSGLPKSNIKLYEEVLSLLDARPSRAFYLDLYEHYLRVEVWDDAATCPNTFLGEFQMPLVNIARGGLNHVWTISNTVMQKRKKVITDVAIVRFVCVFQEVLDFEMRLQNWSARLRTSIMRRETTKMEGAAEDEEQEEDEEVVHKPCLTFLLGNRKFSTWLHFKNTPIQLTRRLPDL